MKPAVRQLLLGGGRLSLDRFGPSRPLYVAHRGGALVAPEDTLEAARHSVDRGAVAIEHDVQALADGSLGVMHDATIDRTTTGIGNVVDQSPAQWAALAIDAASQNIGGFGDALVPPLYPALANEFRGRAILVSEVKATAVKQTLVNALLAAGVRKDQALVNSFTLSDLAPAVAAGYRALYFPTSTLEIPSTQAAGVTWVGVSAASPDSDFQQWIAAGFKVLAYTVSKRYRRDQLLALGVSGVVADDPAYVSSNGPLASRDAFSLGKWMPGMLEPGEGTTSAARGAIASSRWGWPGVADVANTRFVLMGWAGYLTAPSFTVSFTARINGVNAADTTRWFNVFLADSTFGDRSYTDSTGTTNEKGYQLIHRKNGTLAIFRRDGGTTATLVTATNATYATTDGVDVFMKITVTPTAVRWARVDAGGTELFAVEATDSLYRGGPMHFGRNGATAEFSNIVIA